MAAEPRKNDELIIYKIGQLHDNVDKLSGKLDAHIAATNKALHGNGNHGLWTTIAVLKTRMLILWGGVVTVAIAVINDYVRG